MIHCQYVSHLHLRRLIHLDFHKLQYIQCPAYCWSFSDALIHCLLKMLHNCIKLMPCFHFIAIQETYFRGQTQMT